MKSKNKPIPFYKKPEWLIPIIITVSLAIFFGGKYYINQSQSHSGIGDNVIGDKVINNYNTEGIAQDNLFYHDSSGRYYSAEEKDYLEMVIGYSASLINQNKHEDAIRILEKAIQKDFSFYGIWINIGNAYFRLGQYGSALNSYEQAIDRNPDSKLAWSNKCLLLQTMGKTLELNDCLSESAKKSNE